jgi:hypothetical protein
MYGSFFRDLNPNIHPEEQYKVNAFVGNRGMYMYVSPDGVNWRRNETIQLPLRSGGEGECFWDDQRGRYASYLKRDSSFDDPECADASGRVATGFWTDEILKAWPFYHMVTPYFEGYPFPSVTCEGPVELTATGAGQVYRTRAIKYPWAPDVYLSFLWRYPGDDGPRHVDLGISRDGENWSFFGTNWYIPLGSAEEELSMYGLIRRGDEIWQYVDEGGAHGGDAPRHYYRYRQRLDGFVSLDAGGTTGTATTLPLVFGGNKLVLNTLAAGSVRVGILTEAGEALPGFDVSDCDAISGDFTERVVTWNGRWNAGMPSGSVVRLRFEMQNAKLYSFQFKRCADIDESGLVDANDLRVISGNWLADNMVTVPAAGPVGWWEFEDGAGPTVSDSAGDNDGMIAGDVNWVAGQVGSYALAFDGAGDHLVTFGNNDSLDVDNSLTISAWVNMDNLASYYFVVNKQPSGTAGGNYPGNYGLRIRLGDGYVQLTHQTSTGVAYSIYTSSSGIAAGAWHHIAATLAEGGTVNFYIGGSPAGSSPQSGVFGILNDEPVRMGTRKDGYSYFDGTMDDVRIYDYELDAADVMRVYQGLPLDDITRCGGNPGGDMSGDCVVNGVDFALFALEWLTSCP